MYVVWWCWELTGLSLKPIWMDQCKTAVTPLITRWSYCSLALNHRYVFGKYSIFQEICTRFLLYCALLWLYIDWFPISIRLTSLALWQSNDCPSASKATLMNMDKYFMRIHYERLHNHNKAEHNKTVCIFLGIYCIMVLMFTPLPSLLMYINYYSRNGPIWDAFTNAIEFTSARVLSFQLLFQGDVTFCWNPE